MKRNLRTQKLWTFYETTNKYVGEIKQTVPETSAGPSVNKLQRYRPPIKKCVARSNHHSQYMPSHATNPKSSYRCLGDHPKHNCRFKDVLCNYCKMKEHIAKACKAKSCKHSSATSKTYHLEGATQTVEANSSCDEPSGSAFNAVYSLYNRNVKRTTVPPIKTVIDVD